MRFPLTICTKGKLIIAPVDFFDGIGRLDLEKSILEVNVAQDGVAGFAWLLDADGLYYSLSSKGLMSPSLLQRVGLRRQIEQFKIAPGRKIRVEEVRALIGSLHDQFDEAPNASDLNRQLDSYPPEHVLEREDMRRYLGEQNS